MRVPRCTTQLFILLSTKSARPPTVRTLLGMSILTHVPTRIRISSTPNSFSNAIAVSATCCVPMLPWPSRKKPTASSGMLAVTASLGIPRCLARMVSTLASVASDAECVSALSFGVFLRSVLLRLAHSLTFTRSPLLPEKSRSGLAALELTVAACGLLGDQFKKSKLPVLWAPKELSKFPPGVSNLSAASCACWNLAKSPVPGTSGW
mmetsp:Transcript_95085/g.268561  ORF Transcript_95085/g.268561 Transcript_95085/m.268561 type:complete len:207 (+) Transcript_95085:67-687(+)